MDTWIQLTIVLVVLLGFWVLGSSHLLTCIRCVAWQGALLAALPLFLPEGRGIHAAVLAAAALLLKAGMMPWLLWRAIRTASSSALACSMSSRRRCAYIRKRSSGLCWA